MCKGNIKWLNLGIKNGVQIVIQKIGYAMESPVSFKHEAKTYATIPDGGAILMTGLNANTNGRGRSGVPLLQDLPVIGNAFSNRFYQKDKESYSCLLNARMILLEEEEVKQTGSN